MNIFRHLNLEIALAIPASNDKKVQFKKSAEQRLKHRHPHYIHIDFGNSHPVPKATCRVAMTSSVRSIAVSPCA